MASRENISFSIREAKAHDAEVLGKILHRAYKHLHANLEEWPVGNEFATVESCIELLSGIIQAPTTVFSVTAVDTTDQNLGSGYLHHDAEVYSIGPISVAPEVSSKGVGKAIVTSLVDRAKQEGAKSIRLTQTAANLKSFALYSGLGFVPCDCFAVYEGSVKPEKTKAAAYALGFAADPDVIVRIMEDADVEACAQLHQTILGYDRAEKIRASLGPTAWVASKSDEILAYTTGFENLEHTVARRDEDFITLYNGIPLPADVIPNLQIFPRLNPRLNQWALASKFSMTSQHWYMVFGDYKAPAEDSVFLPSVLH